MRCLTCAYDLSASPAGPCPECGRAFEPADPLTYRSPETDRRSARRNTIAICGLSLAPLAFFALVHLVRIAARLSLGRWPRPSLDDPKGIPGVEPFLTLAYLAALAMLPCLGAACILWLVLLWLHPSRCLPALLFLVALAGGGFSLLCWDPGDALTWFMD
ncbi:MAG TPA: hypothetical protein VFF69_06040 [Phycisphaerales bacterium]|nr:hypothetical protein [Phycisphaerales bacterium]